MEKKGNTKQKKQNRNNKAEKQKKQAKTERTHSWEITPQTPLIDGMRFIIILYIMNIAEKGPVTYTDIE